MFCNLFFFLIFAIAWLWNGCTVKSVGEKIEERLINCRNLHHVKTDIKLTLAKVMISKCFLKTHVSNLRPVDQMWPTKSFNVACQSFQVASLSQPNPPNSERKHLHCIPRAAWKHSHTKCISERSSFDGDSGNGSGIGLRSLFRQRLFDWIMAGLSDCPTTQDLLAFLKSKTVK